MSRAFTKEPEGDAAVEDLAEIPISPHPNIVTARGLQLIEEKIAQLQMQAETPEGKVRAMAGSIRRDLRYWIARRASAELAPEQADTSEIRFGHSVTVRRNGQEDTYKIVGQDEADPARGLISYVSPLARAIMGAAVGDIVQAGEQEIEILAIKSS